MRAIYLLLFFLLIGITSNAQDSLPNFSLKLISNKVSISWINPYPNLVQLTIQRSYDSSKNYRTIFSTQSPELPQNGYIDKNYVPGLKAWYRIFYMKAGGEYTFTNSKSTDSKPVVYVYTADLPTNNINDVFKIFKNDSLLTELTLLQYRRFRDSITIRTKDTLTINKQNEVIIKPFIAKPLWKPSANIYTDEKTNIIISLADFSSHKYHIRFLDSTGQLLFQIRQIKDSYLILDKANFIKTGWVYFELLDGEALIEKNKFQLIWQRP